MCIKLLNLFRLNINKKLYLQKLFRMKNEETLIKKNGFGQLSFCKECNLFFY